VDSATARRLAPYRAGYTAEQRRDIEQRSAEGIADLLTLAFDRFCAPETASAQ